MSTEGMKKLASSSRALGVSAMAAGVALTYWFVYLPYRSCMLERLTEPLHWHGIIVIPLILGFGVIHGIVGRPAIRVFGTPDSPTRAWWALATFLMLAGVVLVWSLDSALDVCFVT